MKDIINALYAIMSLNINHVNVQELGDHAEVKVNIADINKDIEIIIRVKQEEK